MPQKITFFAASLKNKLLVLFDYWLLQLLVVRCSFPDPDPDVTLFILNPALHPYYSDWIQVYNKSGSEYTINYVIRWMVIH